MKKRYFLTILFIFLFILPALTGCLNPNSQKTIVAQTTVTIVEDQRQYTFLLFKITVLLPVPKKNLHIPEPLI